MKKIIALVLTMALVLGSVLALASCGEDPLAKAYNNYLAEIKKGATTGNGTLTVATSPDFAPMEFYDAAKSGDEAIVGFDILLANYLAKELGMALEIKPMSFDACQAAVQTGTVDIALSGFSYTADRAENYELSDWYEAGDNETEQILITTAANVNELKTTTMAEFAATYAANNDGAEVKIGFQGASLQEILVKDNFTDMENVDINNSYVDLGTAAEALKTGKIQFLAVAKGNGESIIAAANDALALSGFEFVVDDLYKNNVVLLQKGDTALLAQINAALTKLKATDYQNLWYEACKIYAGVSTADELGYDENGIKITDAE